MNNILKPEEIKNYRDLGKKLDLDKVNEVLRLAQNIDLRKKLGHFIYQTLENIDNPVFADLLIGCSFEYQGDTYYHEGIKSILADYFYARFLYKININITHYGATHKKSNDSEPVDRKVLQDEAKQAQIDANDKFELVDLYLKSKSDIFPSYSNSGSTPVTTNSIRFYTI